MKNKRFLLFILLSLFSVLLNSSINANTFTDKFDFIESAGKINCEILTINNGIIIGRTIMTINSKTCGSLEFVNITFTGEQTKKIKSGLFGFFIVRIPIGKYFVSASKYGFHDTYTNVMLFTFKPFAIITLKLEKKGWDII
jgi:hypothetical protein